MQSRIIINIALLVLVIALAMVMLRNEPETDNERIVLVSDVDRQTINTIKIGRAEKPVIVFEKTGADWQMTAPYQAPAHPNRIQSMLGLLTTKSHNQITVDVAQLDQLGLDTPAVSLQLNEDTFEFGLTNPLDQTRYVRIGDSIHTIQDQLFHQLNTNERFFINPKLILQPDKIASIKTPEYTLIKDSEQWTLDPPPEAVETTANVLLNAWQQLQANQVQHIDKDNVNGTVVITQTDGSQFVFDIMSRTPELILINRSLSLQYHISSSMADMIFPTPVTVE